MSLKFVGLHAHTGLSIGDAIAKPKDHFDFVIKNAESDSMALAISDHGNASSYGYILQALDAYKKKGIPFKGIYGIEAYVHPSLSEWKQLKEKAAAGDEETAAFIENEQESKGRHYNPINRRHHLVILAKNNEGLKNIFRLVSRSYREGFYRMPRMDFAMLEEHKEGLLVTSACLSGDTIVSTNYGEISLREAIDKHNNGKEIFVLSVNLSSLKLEYKKINWGALTKKNQKLLKIKLSNGKQVKLTADHKVYTNLGWVEAGNLKNIPDIKILSF